MRIQFERAGARWTIAALLLAVPARNAVAASVLPNVIMIMSDDIGWSDIGACRRRQGLSDPIPTPNIDRLAAEGMLFTDCHAPASLCAPTRFSMLTGSYPYRNGRQWGTWSLQNTSAFMANRRHTTVAEIMQRAGYRTAMIGKMHFGGNPKNSSGDVTHDLSRIDFSRKIADLTIPHGFDYSFGSHQGIQNEPYLFLENDKFVPIDSANPADNSSVTNWAPGDYAGTNGAGNIPKAGRGDEDWNSSRVGIAYSDKAVAFVDNHLANHPEQPFLLYYMSQAVHVPHTPPVDFEPEADGSPGSPPNEPVAGVTVGDELADMVYELDLQVGKLVNKLEDPNGDGNLSDSILADTLIFFTSDNGGLASDRGIPGYDSTGILRGSKGQIWEGGHRVPFLVRWGDGTPAGSRIAPGSVSDQLICAHDWIGVMYALTEQGMPSDQAMDCVDMLPVLLGEQDEDDPIRDFIFHQSRTRPAGGNGDNYAIRRGDYVLFLDGSKNPSHLFDLALDPAQTTNLLSEPDQQDRISEMEALYTQHDGVNEPRSTPAYLPPEPDIAVTRLVPLWTEDFAAALESGNRSAPFPPNEWHSSDATGWQRDDHGEFNSLAVSGVADTLTNPVLLIGFGFDEIEARYYEQAPLEPGMDYVFQGTWELNDTGADNHLGFIAGVAEYDHLSGDIVQVVTSATFGVLAAPVVDGVTNTFRVTVTAAELAAAGVADTNCLGVFFHHDDVLPLYADNGNFGTAVKNDGYYVDDLAFGYPDIDEDGLVDVLEQRVVDAEAGDAVTNITDVLPGQDFDGDGSSNLHEQGAGTDMVSAFSVFRVERMAVRPAIEPAGDYEFEVSWQGVTGRLYRVLTRSDPAGGEWVQAAGGIAGQATCTHTLPATNANLFVTIGLDEWPP